MIRRHILTGGIQLLPSLFKKLKLHTGLPKVLCSAHDKHLPSPNVPTPIKKVFQQDTDILLEELRRVNSKERLLELTSMHLEVMNSKHIITCFTAVHDLHKHQDMSSLTENEVFQAVCSRLMSVVRFLDSQDLITVFKTLAALGVRSNSYVMHSVLKMLGSHLNDMTLSQLTFLNFLIYKQRHNSLVDGLRMALPLVLQVQIDQQLDSKNIGEIVSCLQMACKARLKTSTIEKIVAALLDGANSLTPNHGVSIAVALLQVQIPVDGAKTLLNLSFDIIAKNIEQLTKKQIITIARFCRFYRFYHHSFFYSTVSRVLSEKWDFELYFELVNYLHQLGLSHSALVDHLSKLICSESTVKNSFHYSPLNFLEYFTATGHRPIHIKETLEIICTWDEKISTLCKKSPNLMLKFISCLSILDYFPQHLLEKVLNEEFLFQAWANSKKHGRAQEFEYNLFSIVWGLELSGQKDKFQIPLHIVKKASLSLQQRYVNSEHPLAKFIECGLGGAQFLYNGIFTHDGHVIDHVLVMRSGNYPVSLHALYKDAPKSSNPVLFVEDIQLPDDAKIITVIVAHENEYCKEPEVLTGFMELKIRSLAKKGYSPVVINFQTWNNLPDREKIPYLMREIKQVVEIADSERTRFLS